MNIFWYLLKQYFLQLIFSVDYIFFLKVLYVNSISLADKLSSTTWYTVMFGKKIIMYFSLVFSSSSYSSLFLFTIICELFLRLFLVIKMCWIYSLRCSIYVYSHLPSFKHIQATSATICYKHYIYSKKKIELILSRE